MKVTLICCLGLQVAIISSLVAAAPAVTEIKRSEIVSGFDQLNLYLESEVASANDLLENLKAARELLSSEEKKDSCFSLFPRKKDRRYVAELFVNLLEVAGVDPEKTTQCDERTTNYLEKLNIAHGDQVWFVGGSSTYTTPGESEPRYHLVEFGNVDRLLDTQLVRIIANCESQFLEPAFERLSSQLDPQVDEKLNRQVLPESTVYQLDDMKHDHRVLLSSLAHRIDMDGHKAILASGDLETFTEYYANLYRTYLSEPCKVFSEHFAQMMTPMDQVEAFRRRFMIPVDRSRPLKLARARRLECYMVNEMSDDQVVERQAEDVLKDYQGSLRDNNLKWNGEGRRLY